MKISITFLVTMLQVVFTIAIQAAEKTWTGANSSSWNLASNWQPAGIPAITDDVIFNGLISNSNCALPSSVVIKNMQVLSSYSGTVYIAFRYEGTDAVSTTTVAGDKTSAWEVDNVRVLGL
jgi:hypothetical protein